MVPYEKRLSRSIRIEHKSLRDIASKFNVGTTSKIHAVCCLRSNAGYGAALQVRKIPRGKIYAVIEEPDSEANNLIRVIDESGDDYAYPARMFEFLDLPGEMRCALR